MNSSKRPPQGAPLPIQHPDYRYPESRNPYSQKVGQFEGLIFSENETEAHRGEWLSQFPDAKERSGENLPRRPLHVEIGCNAGHVVREWAARNPAGAYIGIDWKVKQIFRGAEKAHAKDLRNLLFFRAHADRLPYMFADGEIDHLYLYFPDPWPKKSQLKNRWVKPENLRAAARLVRPGGTFHIKTDHFGYFQWMEDAVKEVDSLWEVTDRTTDLHANHPDPTSLTIPEVTLFERLFIKDGIKINSLWLRRR